MSLGWSICDFWRNRKKRNHTCHEPFPWISWQQRTMNWNKRWKNKAWLQRWKSELRGTEKLSSNEGWYFDGEPYGEYTLPDVLVEKNTGDALDFNFYSDDSIFLEISTIRLSPSECLNFISFNSSSIASILLWNIELSLFSFLLVTPNFAVLDDSLKGWHHFLSKNYMLSFY